METVREPNFYDWSIYIENEVEGKPLSPQIVETLSRLVGFDSDRRQQTPLICNSDGELRVRSEAQRSDVMLCNHVTALAAATLIVSGKPKRKALYLHNEGPTACYISYQTAAIAAQGLEIPVDGDWYTDMYTGPIYGLDAAATAVLNVMEILDPDWEA